jgi:hypothetical protein
MIRMLAPLNIVALSEDAYVMMLIVMMETNVPLMNATLNPVVHTPPEFVKTTMLVPPNIVVPIGDVSEIM